MNKKFYYIESTEMFMCDQIGKICIKFLAENQNTKRMPGTGRIISVKHDTVILIGMPASGKSTAGVILAKQLGYDFVDTDLLIQTKYGSRLEELIRDHGIENFLNMEAEVCRDLQVSRCVVATGGSVIYRHEAMEHLRDIGTIVYLDVPLEELGKRLNDMKARGVVLRKGERLEDLYSERSALYTKYADICVREEQETLEETVQRVLAKVKF